MHDAHTLSRGVGVCECATGEKGCIKVSNAGRVEEGWDIFGNILPMPRYFDIFPPGPLI